MAKYGRAGWLAGINDDRPIDYAVRPLPPEPTQSGYRVSDFVVAYYLRLHGEETQTYFRAVFNDPDKQNAIAVGVRKRIEAGDVPVPQKPRG